MKLNTSQASQIGEICYIMQFPAVLYTKQTYNECQNLLQPHKILILALLINLK